MSKHDDGGAAFPHAVSKGSPFERLFDGMSLRDYLAAKAMQGALSNLDVFDAITKVGRDDGIDRAKAIALFSFDMADAMIEQRSK